MVERTCSKNVIGH